MWVLRAGLTTLLSAILMEDGYKMNETFEHRSHCSVVLRFERDFLEQIFILSTLSRTSSHYVLTLKSIKEVP